VTRSFTPNGAGKSLGQLDLGLDLGLDGAPSRSGQFYNEAIGCELLHASVNWAPCLARAKDPKRHSSGYGLISGLHHKLSHGRSVERVDQIYKLHSSERFDWSANKGQERRRDSRKPTVLVDRDAGLGTHTDSED